MSTMPGPDDQFGPYLIRRLLGSGGMGAVYVATQTTLDRDVALKVLLPMYADAPDYRTRFAREASALARVDSPHIIQIFDYGEHEHRLFIATQLVGGGDLGIYLHERGALPVSDACLLAAQIASALADAHEAGVIHRDVKPANVLLGASADRPHVYLCDFGIATDGGEGLTTTGAVAGTWAYLAPERCQGADASRASDVYALGCLLWQLLTGNPPYAGSPAHVAMQHLTASIPKLGGEGEVIDSLNAFLRRALAKDIEERATDAAAASVELERIGRLAAQSAAVHAEPARRVARPPSDAEPRWASNPTAPIEDDAPDDGPRTAPIPAPPTPSTPQARRRRGRRAALALALAAVLGVASGVLAWSLRDPGPDGSSNAGDLPRGELGHRLVTGDFNGDEQADALIQVRTGEVTDLVLVPGTAAGSGAPVVWSKDSMTEFARPLAAADVDDDGVTDVVSIGPPAPGGRVLRLLSGSASGFAEPADVGTLKAGGGSVSLVLGDVDGDGSADAITLTDSPDGGAQLVVLLWQDGSFGEAQTWARIPDTAQDSLTIRAIDMDHDGRTDVAAFPENTADVVIFRSNGAGFEDGAVWGTLERQVASHFVTADFTGDDLGDIAVARNTDSGVVIEVARSADGRLLPPEVWLKLPGWSLADMWIARARIDSGPSSDMMVFHPADGSEGVAFSALISDGKQFSSPAPLRTVEDWRW